MHIIISGVQPSNSDIIGLNSADVHEPIVKGFSVQIKPLFIGLLSLVASCANATEVHAQTCNQIRDQIKAQTGALPDANTELLHQLLYAQQGCRFSATEVWRAAYGDKPFPVAESRTPSSRDRGDG